MTAAMFATCSRRLQEDGKEEHITEAEFINSMHKLYPPEKNVSIS